MALNDKILKNFFDKGKVTPISTSIKKFRVFDDLDYHRHNNEQSSKLIKDKPETNQRQTEESKKTNWGQTKDSITETKDKAESKSKTNLETNQRQSRDVNNLETTYSSLVGLQKTITLFIYDYCQIARSDTTKQISIDFLSDRCKTTKSSAKKTIQRLEHKDVVTRPEYKNGRNGWSKYQLNEKIYQQISYEESRGIQRENWRQNEDKVESKPGTKLETTPPSSSSFNRSTTNTNEAYNTQNKHQHYNHNVSYQQSQQLTENNNRMLEQQSLPSQSSTSLEFTPEWKAIDFSPLEDIGFNMNKLQQIYQAGLLSADMVQESIYGYDFDRKHNGVKHNSPIAFLMSQLKVKGLPYDLPSNYESPKVRALRLYNERMIEQEKKEAELKESLKTREFEKWLSALTEDEKNTLVPPTGLYARTAPRRGAFYHHFDTNIWPEKEKSIYAGIFA